MRKHFDFYGYNSPTAGLFYADEEVYTLGEDYRNVKRYKEYKNVGFNILLLQHENSYSGEDFSTSACKKCMDNGYKAGLNRIIVSDTRLKDLCEESVLVGEGGKFENEEAFLAYLKQCIAPYENHPGFYGVQLFDEPKYSYLKNYAKVYAGLKKVKPSIEMQANLLNLCAPQCLAENPCDRYQDYENYLQYFYDECHPDYLMTDEYAFRRNNEISPYTIPTYEILAKVCKRNKIEMRLVMQSFSQEGRIVNKDNLMEGGVAWRRIGEKDMYWQMNLALGFGCKEFSFFTYFTKTHIYFKGTRAASAGVDGAAMVNHDGSRTKLYYIAKKIIKEIKDFEPVIINYNFYKDYYFTRANVSLKDFSQTACILSSNQDCDVKISTDADTVCVCEMHDKGQNRMFMVENITNTINQLMYKQKANKVAIDLRALSGTLNIYKKGKKIDCPIVDGVITLKMNCGDAIFIEELK